MRTRRLCLAPSIQRIIYCLFFILVCARVVFTSWVEEDAFITFRVVDNLVHGLGLRWNINERVQTYTNPFWMLLHVPLYAVIDNILLTTWALSWSCLVATLYVTQQTFGFSPLRLTALFLIPILISPTLTLYFTSGLETPLLSLLFVCSGFIIVRQPSRNWFWLSLITALSGGTRVDTLLFYAPIWACLLFQHWNTMRWKEIVLGALPLAGWLVFSLFYYGFLLPNTALAKLDTGIPLHRYLRSGTAYTLDFLLADPWVAGLTGAAIVFFPFQAWRQRGQKDPRFGVAASIAVGIGLYSAYIIYIGGYQLSLRMSSLPAIAACWLWLWRLPLMTDLTYICTAAIAMLIQITVAQSPEKRDRFPYLVGSGISGIPWGQYLLVPSDESFVPYRFNTDVMKQKPNHDVRERKVVVTMKIGQDIYYHGPDQIVIDPLALSEPLLARLPAIDPHSYRVGHVVRAIPEGYVDAVETGSTQKMPLPLRRYYEKLRLITQGELLDPERLETIIRFNLGEYEPWRKEYIENYYYRK